MAKGKNKGKESIIRGMVTHGKTVHRFYT